MILCSVCTHIHTSIRPLAITREKSTHTHNRDDERQRRQRWWRRTELRHQLKTTSVFFLKQNKKNHFLYSLLLSLLLFIVAFVIRHSPLSPLFSSNSICNFSYFDCLHAFILFSIFAPLPSVCVRSFASLLALAAKLCRRICKAWLGRLELKWFIFHWPCAANTHTQNQKY